MATETDNLWFWYGNRVGILPGQSREVEMKKNLQGESVQNVLFSLHLRRFCFHYGENEPLFSSCPASSCLVRFLLNDCTLHNKMSSFRHLLTQQFLVEFKPWILMHRLYYHHHQVPIQQQTQKISTSATEDHPHLLS